MKSRTKKQLAVIDAVLHEYREPTYKMLISALKKMTLTERLYWSTLQSRRSTDQEIENGFIKVNQERVNRNEPLHK